MPHVVAPGIRVVALAATAICALSAGASSSALAAAQAPGDEVQGFENEYTKVFEQADGSYRAEIHTVPINFRNARGAWQTIDPTLVSAPGGFRNSAGPYSVSFAGPGAPPSQDLVTISDGRADSSIAQLRNATTGSYEHLRKERWLRRLEWRRAARKYRRRFRRQ